jgi:hypothetical protein
MVDARLRCRRTRACTARTPPTSRTGCGPAERVPRAERPEPGGTSAGVGPRPPAPYCGPGRPLPPPARGQAGRSVVTDTSSPDLVELDHEECYRLLSTHEIGRLGVNAQHYPLIFPVNYAVEHGVIVIRTHPGTKLAAVLVERVGAVPRLRQRLHRPPPGCGRPVAADVAVTPLPRSRPLWTAVIVTGLPDGRVGLVDAGTPPRARPVRRDLPRAPPGRRRRGRAAGSPGSTLLDGAADRQPPAESPLRRRTWRLCGRRHTGRAGRSTTSCSPPSPVPCTPSWHVAGRTSRSSAWPS